MRTAIRAACLAAGGTLVLAPAAGACVRFGVYQDKPASTFMSLQHSVGKGVTTLSTYVTVGNALDPKLVKLANAQHLKLMVSWLPDSGKDGAKQPKYRLFAVRAGKFDAQLKALGAELRQVHKGVIFRPMPEPNTPWYAWSGTVNGNAPGMYQAAWGHVRKVIKASAGSKVKFLWSPYARSVPDTPANAIKRYFPGKAQVDLVGADGYNFGAAHSLAWTDPTALFGSSYQTIEGLAPKPFWIAETGSTATGGDLGAWISSLGTLGQTMPKLAGVVWYDVKDQNGDFRISQSPSATGAFKSLLGRSCR
jgi:hypothetical protein